MVENVKRGDTRDTLRRLYRKVTKVGEPEVTVELAENVRVARDQGMGPLKCAARASRSPARLGLPRSARFHGLRTNTCFQFPVWKDLADPRHHGCGAS